MRIGISKVNRGEYRPAPDKNGISSKSCGLFVRQMIASAHPLSAAIQHFNIVWAHTFTLACIHPLKRIQSNSVPVHLHDGESWTGDCGFACLYAGWHERAWCVAARDSTGLLHIYIKYTQQQVATVMGINLWISVCIHNTQIDNGMSRIPKPIDWTQFIWKIAAKHNGKWKLLRKATGMTEGHGMLGAISWFRP